MPTIYVEGKPYEVAQGKNLLEAVLSLGFDLPYFCWHPALGSVGACRQCAVIQYKDEEGEKKGEGKLQMACMLPASDGTRISIKALEAKQFRANVIEWLMVNHPHDCPVCDEGGECHLQDMTVMTGHAYREFRFKKRTHRNQYLGSFINHEMNRCIACYRCVRYYKEFAGGEDLDVFATHDHVYFGRHEDGTLESEFSGNLVEVCPTGVFTDRTLKQHYTRKWDLQSAPSVCHHCGLGCNTIGAMRYDKMVRILNRYNRDVNGYFICDRGRFGYEFVNSDRRIRQSRTGDGAALSRPEASRKAADMLGSTKRILGIGSPRASLEANYALRRLVGEENFCNGLSSSEDELINRIIEVIKTGPTPVASLHDVERADAVLVLGEDLTNTAPMLDLAVRQASRNKPSQAAKKIDIPLWNDAAVRELVQDEKGPLFLATPAPTRLDKIATRAFRAVPDDIARLGFAIAHELDNKSPAVGDLSDELRKTAREAVDALKDASHPVIIAGTSLHSMSIIDAAANTAKALQAAGVKARIVFTVPECNSLGSGLAGGESLDAALEKVRNDDYDSVVILENDLYRRFSEKDADSLFSATQTSIVIDQMDNHSTEQADLVLPAATFADSDGTLINNEGRAQRFYQIMNPDTHIQESWRWIRDIMKHLGRNKTDSWDKLDDIARAAFLSLPGIAMEIQVAPDESYRVVDQKIPRSPHRFSGRTAISANHTLHEPKPPDDPDSPFSFSMEGYLENPPSSSLIPFFWSPGWNSVQSTTKYQQEVGGHLRGGDPGVRLIEPSTANNAKYADSIPSAFSIDGDRLLLIPLYHIFGSEEMSARAAALSERVPEPYAAINPETASRFEIQEGVTLRIVADDYQRELPVRIIKNIARHIIGVPTGLPGSGAALRPAIVKVETGAKA